MNEGRSDKLSDIKKMNVFGNTNNKVQYEKKDSLSLLKAIDSTEYESHYDEECKLLLSYKEVLARILKGCVSEYEGYDIDTIIRCLEKDAPVSKETVLPNERIIGDNTEDSNLSERLLRYDIKFTTITPDNEPIQLIINVEGQNRISPFSNLVKRSIYYACRLISSQNGTIFTANKKEDTGYEKIIKVYTIWICMNNFNTNVSYITKLSMGKEDIAGVNTNITKEDYDLLTSIIIRLPKDPNKQKSSLVRFLTYLLTNKYSASEKKRILSEEYGIKKQEIDERIDKMASLGAEIREEGRQEAKREMIINFYKLGIDTRTIADGVKLDEQKVIDIIKQYKEQ